MNVVLVVSFVISGLVCLALPVAVGLVIARAYGTRWRYWFVGAGVFLIFQLLTRIPAITWLQTRPFMRDALNDPVWLTAFLWFAALTAGLFEEAGRWLALRFVIRPPDRTVPTALMLGAGHGGLECMLVAFSQFAALSAYVVMHWLPLEGYPELIQALAEARKEFDTLVGWEPLLAAWERLWALVLQIALTLMVLRAFTHRGIWWFGALAFHTLVDFTTVGALQLLQRLVNRSVAMVLTEGLVALYGVVALALVVSSTRAGLHRDGGQQMDSQRGSTTSP